MVRFLSDFAALDRLRTLSSELGRADRESARTALIQAQVASTLHLFSEAREWTAVAASRGASPTDTNRLMLNIDQATGAELDRVLAERRQSAAEANSLEDLVSIGALLAELEDYEGANETYQQALISYQHVSPFAVAMVCFYLGVLWGELVPEPQMSRATAWYEDAVAVLPAFVKARVHLSEVYLECGRADDAENILLAAIASRDPEAHWRLANVLKALGRPVEAERHLKMAHVGFVDLVDRYPLAFADHGAEFYGDSGQDPTRALELARLNFSNRPTRQASKQVYELAIAAGNQADASQLTADAISRCRFDIQ